MAPYGPCQVAQEAMHSLKHIVFEIVFDGETAVRSIKNKSGPNKAFER